MASRKKVLLKVIVVGESGMHKINIYTKFGLIQ